MRTTLDLPEALFRALKARAAMDGTTLKDLVERLVRAGLAAADRGGAPRTPSRLPPPVRGGRRKMKAYSNADLAALADSLTDR
jgi:hypothetical protein